MGKLDDLRKQREAQYALQQGAERAKGTNGVTVRHAEDARPKDAEQKAEAAQNAAVGTNSGAAPHAGGPSNAGQSMDDVAEGKCAVCGKMKAVQSGLVASHQKGLGKMCPGSRKAPV